MAYLLSPKRGRWRVRWRDETGKQCTSPWFDDKSEALEELATRSARAQASRRTPRGARMNLLQLVEAYILEREREKRAKAGHLDKTRSALRRLFKAKKWEQLSDLKVGQIGSLKIGEHRALKSVLRYAASLGARMEDGLLFLRPPRRNRKPQATLLTREQVAALIDAAGTWCESNAALAHLLSTYGHRPETAVNILVRHLDPDAGTLNVEVKGGDQLRHPLLPATVAWLRPLTLDAKGEKRPGEDFLFIGHDGAPWGTGQRFASFWYHYVGGRVTAPKDADGKATGAPSHPGVYELKRFAISSMLEGGLAPKTICSITGHRTPATLHLYARTNEDRQREALAVLASLPTRQREALAVLASLPTLPRIAGL